MALTSTEVAVTETLNPSLSKPVWIDRCIMHLGKLKPDMSLLEAQTVAMNILWSDDCSEAPEQVATAWARDPVESD
jgi:hypothetical protein